MKDYRLLLLLILAFSVLSAGASEERPKQLRSFDAQVDDSAISITTGEFGRISQIRLKAFGRTIDVSKKDLEKVKDFRFSAIRITEAAGYEETGGHTLYFILSHKGFFGGDPFEGDPLLEETLRISVQAKGSPRLNLSRKESKFD